MDDAEAINGPALMDLGLTGATPGGRSMIFTVRYNF
jgi:hypothetical protein